MPIYLKAYRESAIEMIKILEIWERHQIRKFYEPLARLFQIFYILNISMTFGRCTVYLLHMIITLCGENYNFARGAVNRLKVMEIFKI